MDETEAREILSAELARWRARSYAALSALVGESDHVDRIGPDGADGCCIAFQVAFRLRLEDD